MKKVPKINLLKAPKS